MHPGESGREGEGDYLLSLQTLPQTFPPPTIYRCCGTFAADLFFNCNVHLKHKMFSETDAKDVLLSQKSSIVCEKSLRRRGANGLGQVWGRNTDASADLRFACCWRSWLLAKPPVWWSFTYLPQSGGWSQIWDWARCTKPALESSKISQVREGEVEKRFYKFSDASPPVSAFFAFSAPTDCDISLSYLSHFLHKSHFFVLFSSLVCFFVFFFPSRSAFFIFGELLMSVRKLAQTEIYSVFLIILLALPSLNIKG